MRARRVRETHTYEANDQLTPEQLFLVAVDDAPEARRANKIEKLIRAARFPIPEATIAELDYRDSRQCSRFSSRKHVLFSGHATQRATMTHVTWREARQEC